MQGFVICRAIVCTWQGRGHDVWEEDRLQIFYEKTHHFAVQNRSMGGECALLYVLYVHVSCICGPPYDVFCSTVVVYMYMYVDGILCKLSPAFLLSVILAIVKRVSG